MARKSRFAPKSDVCANSSDGGGEPAVIRQSIIVAR
jgi:hypothetical protein